MAGTMKATTSATAFTSPSTVASVVAHELGHVLGYEDAGSDGPMAEYLGTGVRRVPALSLFEF